MKTAKSQTLGDKLSQYELNLYEYSAFSLLEEIDIFYCKKKNLELFENEFDEDSLMDKIQYLLEMMEAVVDDDKKSKLIQ